MIMSNVEQPQTGAEQRLTQVRALGRRVVFLRHPGSALECMSHLVAVAARL